MTPHQWIFVKYTPAPPNPTEKQKLLDWAGRSIYECSRCSCRNGIYDGPTQYGRSDRDEDCDIELIKRINAL